MVKLAGNSPTQTVAAFTGINNPVAVSVDGSGNLFVADAHSTQVLWADSPRSAPTPPWQATYTSQWAGPFSGLQAPRGVYIVGAQSFWVVDGGNNRVLKWRFGTNAPQAEAFTGLNNPDGLAIATIAISGWSTPATTGC